MKRMQALPGRTGHNAVQRTVFSTMMILLACSCFAVLPSCSRLGRKAEENVRILNLRERFNRANFAVLRGEYEFAVAEMRQLGIETKPTDDINDDLAYWLGYCYEELGRPDLAADSYRRVILIFPGSRYSAEATKKLELLELRGLLQAAEEAIAQGKPQEAWVKLEVLSGKIKPTHELADDLVHQLARCYEAMGNGPKALACYEKLATDFPGSPHAAEAREKWRALEKASEKGQPGK